MWKRRSIWMRTDELTRNLWAGNWCSPSLGNDLLSLAHWKHFLLTDCFLSAPSYPFRSSKVNTKGDFIRKPHFSYASRIEILSPCSFSELLSRPSRRYNLNVWPSSATMTSTWSCSNVLHGVQIPWSGPTSSPMQTEPPYTWEQLI